MNQGRCPVLLPQLPAPSTPQSSTSNPSPPPQNTLRLNSEGQQDNVDSVATSPNYTCPHVEENTEVQVKEPQADVSPMESMKVYLHSAGPASSPSPPSTISHRSCSDFSRPPSRVFSRSTNLSGRISGLSGKSKLWNWLKNYTIYYKLQKAKLGNIFATSLFNNFSSLTIQQIPGTQNQNAVLCRHSSRVWGWNHRLLPVLLLQPAGLAHL